MCICVYWINCRFVLFICPSKLCCWRFQWPGFRWLISVWVETSSIQHNFIRIILLRDNQWSQESSSIYCIFNRRRANSFFYFIFVSHPVKYSVCPNNEYELLLVCVFNLASCFSLFRQYGVYFNSVNFQQEFSRGVCIQNFYDQSVENEVSSSFEILFRLW